MKRAGPGISWWSSDQDSILPLQRMQILSLVGELCMLHHVVKKNKELVPKGCTLYDTIMEMTVFAFFSLC